MSSILAPNMPDEVNPDWAGLIDAHLGGWFLKDSDELFRGFKITRNDSVLDVGCGDGVAALFCAERGAHITVADIDAQCVSAVESKLKSQGTARGYEAIVCDSDPLLVPDRMATRVICQEVLEHVASPERVVAELVRAGKAGALYLLTVPGEQGELMQKQFAPSYYFEHPNHIRIFSKSDFTTLVERSGLEIVNYSSSGFFWTFWVSIQWAIRAAKCRQSGDADGDIEDLFAPPYDPVLKSWANIWIKVISTPEGVILKSEMDRLLPKVQIILARKPG